MILSYGDSPHPLRTMMIVDDDNDDPCNLSSQANVVNIAFGDYSGGILGQEADDRVVREGIDAIHAKVPMMIVNFDDDHHHSDDCDDDDDDCDDDGQETDDRVSTQFTPRSCHFHPGKGPFTV